MSSQTAVADATSLDERIAARAEVLSPREREVAAFLSEHREEAAFLSAAEIAARLGTSDATVVRTAKALGYGGLPALRRELADALRARATPAVRLGRSLEDVGEDPLGGVLELQIELLEDARSTISRADFARAVDLLAGAERVLLFGIGPNAPLADYAELRLVRFGRRARAITATGLRLADALLDAAAGDALLLIAYERLDRDADVALGRANDLGLPVVLVTDALAAKLADRVDVALPAKRGRGGALSGAAATMALLDALLLALAARDRGRSLAALAELNELRRELRGRALPEELP